MHIYCSNFVDLCLYLDWKGNRQNNDMTKTNNSTFQLPEVSPPCHVLYFFQSFLARLSCTLTSATLLRIFPKEGKLI